MGMNSYLTPSHTRYVSNKISLLNLVLAIETQTIRTCLCHTRRAGDKYFFIYIEYMLEMGKTRNAMKSRKMYVTFQFG